MDHGQEHHELKRCEVCGKLFRAAPERMRCHVCAGEAVAAEMPPPSPEEAIVPLAGRRLAALMAWYDAHSEGLHQGLIPQEAEGLLSPALAVDPTYEAEGGCTLCGKPRLKGAEYCMECLGKLRHEFGNAAMDALSNVHRPEPQSSQDVRSALSDLEEHRERLKRGSNSNPYIAGGLRPT